MVITLFFHTSPTRIDKRIIFAILEDETGLCDVVILPRVQKARGRLIFRSEILTLAGKLYRRGSRDLSISVTMERAFSSLCGSFEAVAGKMGRKLIKTWCRGSYQ